VISYDEYDKLVAYRNIGGEYCDITSLSKIAKCSLLKQYGEAKNRFRVAT